MSFKSLNHILGVLEEKSSWQDQSLQRLTKCWPNTVEAAVAAHTRPILIQRGVLWVATSSAAWAQTLTFKRQQILQKLNPQLPDPLTDIRFSTAQWQHSRSSSNTRNKVSTDLWRDHPSCLADAPLTKSGEKPNANNPNAAFQQWAKVMQMRSDGLPLCPQCHCPTPPGELQRWAICSICATKQW